MKQEKSKVWSKILSIIFFVIFYAPLVSLIIFSFNDRRSVTSWGGFTFKWYKNLFTNGQILEIVLTTLFIAVISTICAVILGTLAAIGLQKTSNKFKNTVLKLNNLPISNPDIVTAIGLLLLFVSFGIERGYGTMLLAHISFCTPYVIVTVYPKVKSLDPNLLEAAMDLGATPMKALRSAILPQIKSSIFAAAAISFTMSFDDFVISYFTGGKAMNISTYLYASAKKLNPTFNALSTIIILVIVGKIIIDKIIQRRSKLNDDEIESKPHGSILTKILIGVVGVFLVVCPFILGSKSDNVLYIFNAGEYIDNDAIEGVDLLSMFEKKYNCKVSLNTFESNEAAISKLETETYDVVIPSDYAIEQLVLEDGLEKLDWNSIEGFTKDDISKPLLDILNEQYSDLEYNLLDYAVPYFFGSVGIIYNKDTVAYEDLENLGWDILKSSKYKIAFYDSSRDGFMVALKSLGYSMNSNNEEELNEASKWLLDMKKSAKPSFKTDELLDEMPQGIWDISFIYSGDATYVKMLGEENGIDIGYYVPESGTNIFCDGMVIPKNSSNKDLAYKFISFMCEHDNALANTNYVCYTTAVNSVYEEVIAEDGDFCDYLDTYCVNISSKDEMFRYDKFVKEYTSTKFSELKI